MAVKHLNYQLKALCEHNRDGSRSTQAERFKVLQGVANQLQELGFRCMGVKSLKPKHIEALVKQYRNEKLSTWTIKNRLAELRWWAKKIGKQNIIANDNAYYGIGSRLLFAGCYLYH